MQMQQSSFALCRAGQLVRAVARANAFAVGLADAQPNCAAVAATDAGEPLLYAGYSAQYNSMPYGTDVLLRKVSGRCGQVLGDVAGAS